MLKKTTYKAPRRIELPPASPNYPILDELLFHVQQGGYSSNIEQDVAKVINCLKFIEVNLELIGFFVENRKHICQERGYDSSRIYVNSDGSPLVLSDRDKQNGVLRDDFGTSMHFNFYEDAQLAKQALLSYLEEFKEAACAMQQLNQLPLFLQCFEYDKQKGCIEARTRRALKIAEQIRLNDGRLSLDDLFMCFTQSSAYNDDKLTDAEKRQAAHAFFQSSLYKNATIKVAITEQNALCLGLPEGTSEIELDENHIDAYLKHVLCWVWQEPTTSEPSPTVNSESYSQKTKDCYTIALGRTNTMVQYHFSTHEQASSFTVWVKSLDDLQQIGISKANVTTETVFPETTFVVRLSTQQFRCLTHESESTLPPIEKVVAAKREKQQVYDELSSEGGDLSSSTLLSTTRKQLVDLMTQHLDSDAFSEYMFIVLIKRFDSELLNQTVTISDANGSTLLHTAAEMLTEAAFLAFLDRLTYDTVTASITKRTRFHQWTPLHLAARNQLKSGFLALMNKAKVSPEALAEALFAQTHDRETPLHLAAQYQTGVAFQECLKRLIPMNLEGVERLGTRTERCTVLQTVAKYQTPEVFGAFVDAMTVESLDYALAKQNMDSQSALHVAARYQPHTEFSKLLDKVSSKAVSNALPMQDKHKQTALHVVLHYQCVKNVEDLITKADGASISATLPLKNSNASSALTVCMKEKPSLTLLLLSKSSFESLEKAAIDSQPYYIVKNILRLLCSTPEEEWSCYTGLKQKLMNVLMIDKVQIKKPVELMLPFLIHRGASSSSQLTILQLLCQLSKSHHTHFAFSSFLSFLNQEAFTVSDKDAVRSETLKQRIHLFEESTNRFIIESHAQSALKSQTIMLSTQEGIPITGVDTGNDAKTTALCQMIWHGGLASWLEYYALIQYHGVYSKVGMTLLTMNNMRTVLSGVANTVLWPTAAIDDVLSLLALIQSGNCLMKVVATSTVDLLLDALADYTVRPAMRKPKSSGGMCKFNHMTDTIEIRPPIRIKYPKPRTRKTPVTWVSPQLQTPLFGLHHELKGMVAIAFNRKACVIKAMLASDVGTYHRGWVGAESKVADYAQSILPFNFTDETAFIQHIETSGLVNEVLAELTKEALEAIVVCIDSDRSRVIALQYQAKVKAKLNIELPIVFYDHTAQVLVPYYIEAKKFTAESDKPSLLSRLSQSISTLFARKELPMSEAEKELAAQLCFSS